MKFEAEGREFAKFLRSLEQFIHIVKGQNIFWQQNSFLTCSWRFLISNKLEQLEFKLEKILGFRNMQEKLEKMCTSFENHKVPSDSVWEKTKNCLGNYAPGERTEPA